MTNERPLIGRDRELSVIRDAIAVAKSGQGRVVLIAGEAGVGKTHIAEACLADSGVRVFSGRIREETMPPFAPIAGVLRDCIRQSKIATDEMLDSRLLPYLALLLPELGPPPESDDHATLVEAIAALLSMSARTDPAAR